jgi:UDP-2,3-diacylglucosamine pyrophosphatase LpxH
MGNRTKRIFISDIHMGEERSMRGPNPYGWFKKNIPLLRDFLAEQLKADDVKEVVILGDLFDMWVIPSNYDPLTSFEDICSNPANEDVVNNLRKLAHPSCEIKLAYVPGNHDMGMDVDGIAKIKRFMENNFPGIRFFCNNTVPWGIYNVGTLAAEHGNHYCLFNAPDIWTSNDTFLPLGYFISRIIAYKVLMTGYAGDPRDIFFNFLKDFMKHPDFIEDMFNAIADDAGLKPGDIIKLNRIPGYPVDMTVGDIGSRFSNLIQNWKNTPGNINVPAAIISDLENLSCAASLAYFEHFGSNTDIVIFGHTHIPTMNKQYDLNPLSDNTGHTSDDPCIYIYANSGTWVDQGKKGCTYVETEEVQSTKRHYVRVKKYPSGDSFYEAFVGM